MKIECILKRDPSTVVPLGDTTYEFKPDATGAHVCEVEDRDHIARFLSIPEGYRLPGDAPIPEDLVEKKQEIQTNQSTLAPDDAADVLAGSTVHPATFDFGGDIGVLAIEDVVADAHELSGLTTAEWNALTPDARHNLIDIALEAIVPGDDDDAGNEEADKASKAAAAEALKATQDAQEKADADAKLKVDADLKADADAKAAEREQLAVAYKEKHGVRPHHKWDIEKVREELAKPAKEGK